MTYDTSDIMIAFGEFAFDFKNKDFEETVDSFYDYMMRKFPNLSHTQYNDAFAQYKQITESADFEQKH